MTRSASHALVIWLVITYIAYCLNVCGCCEDDDAGPTALMVRDPRTTKAESGVLFFFDKARLIARKIRKKELRAYIYIYIKHQHGREREFVKSS